MTNIKIENNAELTRFLRSGRKLFAVGERIADYLGEMVNGQSGKIEVDKDLSAFTAKDVFCVLPSVEIQIGDLVLIAKPNGIYQVSRFGKHSTGKIIGKIFLVLKAI